MSLRSTWRGTSQSNWSSRSAKSTGAANDIDRATGMARRMVTEFGMSRTLGPRAFGKKDELVFLGREISEQRNYSEEVAFQIDQEIRELIDAAHQQARSVVEANGDKLRAIAELLLAEETIEGAATGGARAAATSPEAGWPASKPGRLPRRPRTPPPPPRIPIRAMTGTAHRVWVTCGPSRPADRHPGKHKRVRIRADPFLHLSGGGGGIRTPTSTVRL